MSTQLTFTHAIASLVAYEIAARQGGRLEVLSPVEIRIAGPQPITLLDINLAIGRVVTNIENFQKYWLIQEAEKLEALGFNSKESDYINWAEDLRDWFAYLGQTDVGIDYDADVVS